VIDTSARARSARRIRLPLLAIALTALLSGPWTATAAPTTTTPVTAAAAAVIRGCYYPNPAYVRILTGTQTCRAGETAISWNQTGPAGPQGTTGANGATGPTGPTGPT